MYYLIFFHVNLHYDHRYPSSTFNIAILGSWISIKAKKGILRD